MIKNIYIDGIDVRTAYGVWVIKGGYNELFSFPALKEPVFNDWAEHNGIDVDLKSPKLQPHAVSIDFVASRAAAAAVEGFISLLAKPGYRAMLLPSLGRTFNLRLSDQADNRVYSSLTAFRLNFLLDELTRNEIAVWLSPDVHISESAYSIDGVNLSDYGIFVQSGRDSLLRKPAVKQNLTRNISVLDGQLYDAGIVRFASKEVTFKCCLKASSFDRLWSCRDAFFNNLIRSSEHSLVYKGVTYPVFYKSNSNCRLIALRNGFVMYEFDLTVVVIR